MDNYKITEPIVIFRGDDTDGLGYQSIRGKIKTDLDLAGCRMVFRYLGFTQVYDPIPESKKFVVTIPAEATARFPPGMGFASLRVYDENGKVRTFTNRIPVFVSMTAPSCVGGDFDVEFTGGTIDLEPLKIWTKDGFVDYDGYVERIIDKATADRFGLAMLKDTFESGDDADSGIAATPKSVNAAYAAILGELTDNYYTAAETDAAINALAAYYITSNAAGDAFPTHAALANATVYYSGGAVRTPTRNDYAVVLADETHGSAEWRYIYATNGGGGQWEAQYPIETNDYAGLSNKPSINNITLSGNKTSSDLGLLGNSGAQTLDGTLTIKDQTSGKNVFRGGTGGDLYIDTYLANVLQRTVQFPTRGGDLGEIALKREVPTSASDIGALGNSGNQTLNGTLTATSFKSDPGNGPYCIFGMDGNGKAYIDIDPTGGAGAQRTLIPLGHNETLALLADMYAAVQQIAPDFTAKAYVLNELCSYNGVVYCCKSAYTASAQSTKPNADTTHWEAKKVSELFLGNTGDQMLSGALSVIAYKQDGATFLKAGNDIDENWTGLSAEALLRKSGNSSGYCRIPLADGTLALLSDTLRFSTRVSYAVGDVVFYNGSFWRCKTAHRVGTWIASHFTEVLGLSTVVNNVVYPTASTPASGDDSTKVATTAFVQGALPYAIASVPSGDALSDRTVNTKTVNAATYAPSFPTETSGKSCDFYLAITSDTAGTVSAPSGKTLYNAKGESANLDYEANKTTVLRFTQISANTYVVTGGANGGGSIDPVTLNTKANSTALAPDWRAGNVDTAYAVNNYITYNGNAYVCMVAYTATSSSPTPDNDIYNDTVTPATGHWKLTDMTTPDATLDVTSQGSLRVVSAGGQTLWQQGYKLASASSATLSNEGVNIFTFAAVAAFDDTASYAIGDTVAYDGKAYTFTSAHSGAWTGSDVELAAQSFSLPAAPTGKVGDFILEIDNTANASVAVAIDIAEYTNTTISLVIPDGAAIDDMTTIGGGVRCEFYFTQTAFNVNSKPTWKVVRQDVEVVA